MAVSYIWPAGLPQIPLREGYGEAPGAQVDTFPMDAGQPRTQFAGIAPEEINATIMLTAEQYDGLTRPAADGSFVHFVNDILGFGVARFGFAHPRTGEQIEARFKPDENRKLFVPQFIGVDWVRVTFTLWVLP